MPDTSFGFRAVVTESPLKAQAVRACLREARLGLALCYCDLAYGLVALSFQEFERIETPVPSPGLYSIGSRGRPSPYHLDFCLPSFNDRGTHHASYHVASKRLIHF